MLPAAASRPGKAWRRGDCSRRSARPSTLARFRLRSPAWACSCRSPPRLQVEQRGMRHPRPAAQGLAQALGQRAPAPSPSSSACAHARAQRRQGVEFAVRAGWAQRRAAVGPARQARADRRVQASSPSGAIAYSTGPNAIRTGSQRAFVNGHRTKVGRTGAGRHQARQAAMVELRIEMVEIDDEQAGVAMSGIASAASAPSTRARRLNKAPQAASKSARRPAAGLTNNPVSKPCGAACWDMVSPCGSIFVT